LHHVLKKGANDKTFAHRIACCCFGFNECPHFYFIYPVCGILAFALTEVQPSHTKRSFEIVQNLYVLLSHWPTHDITQHNWEGFTYLVSLIFSTQTFVHQIEFQLTFSTVIRIICWLYFAQIGFNLWFLRLQNQWMPQI
jgi:phosphatidylserine synthase